MAQRNKEAKQAYRKPPGRSWVINLLSTVTYSVCLLFSCAINKVTTVNLLCLSPHTPTPCPTFGHVYKPCLFIGVSATKEAMLYMHIN